MEEEWRMVKRKKIDVLTRKMKSLEKKKEGKEPQI